MSGKKFAKYIMYEVKAPESIPAYRHESAEVTSPRMRRLASLDPGVIKNCPNMGAMWIMPWKNNEDPKSGVEAHVHDFEEIMGWYGCDPENPDDLHGEIEFWFEDEQYFITKSCIMYVPAGVRHCPLKIHNLKKPLLHMGYTPVMPT
jgi:hypothetical protein